MLHAWRLENHLKCPALTCLSQGLFSVHCSVRQAGWPGAFGGSSRSVCSSTEFIDGAVSTGFTWMLGLQNPCSPVCVASIFRTRLSLRPNSISYEIVYLFFLLSFFSLIFSPLSFTPLFIMSTGAVPPNLCITHINISKHYLPSSSETCLSPQDRQCFFLSLSPPCPPLPRLVPSIANVIE